MAEELTFFRGGNITVTNARFIAGSQTFAMRGITSVQGVETPVSYIIPVLLGLLGLVLAVNLFRSGSFFGLIGILILAVAIWIAIRQKPTFAVVLRTAGGDVTAYQSTDRNHIAKIIQALNEAMVSNG